MAGVVSPAPWSRQQPASRAAIYLGVPAYLVVAVLAARDFVDAHGTISAILGIGAMVLFSAVFLWWALLPQVPSPSWPIPVAIAALGVLAILLAALGSKSSLYFAVVAAVAGRNLRPRIAIPVIVACMAAVAAIHVGHNLGGRDTFDQVLETGVVGLMVAALARLAETNQALNTARDQLTELAVVNERLRFARDLHDLLGHSLTVIRAKSELARRIWPTDPDRADQEIGEVEAVARQALAEVREAVSGYRRTTLVAEINHARAALQAAGIAANVSGDDLSLRPADDDALGWVLREAVTNVVRHSGARQCQIETTLDDGSVRLVVADDGKGAASNDGLGSGLAGARERVAACGGTLHTSTPDGVGFRLVAFIPRPAVVITK